MAARHISRQKTLGETARQNTAHVHTSTWSNLSGQRVTDRKKAKKRHLTEGMTHKTLTDLTILTVSGQVEARLIVNVHLQHTTNVAGIPRHARPHAALVQGATLGASNSACEIHSRMVGAGSANFERVNT